MLGAIAMTAGARTWDNYFEDMKQRGQTDDRIKLVEDVLKNVQSTDLKNVDLIQRARQDFANYKTTPDSKLQELNKKIQTVVSLAGQNGIPEDFFCPITQELFIDPVLTEDGHTYERHAITLWIQKNDTSPATGKHLQSKILIPNHAVRRAVVDLCKKFGENLEG